MWKRSVVLLFIIAAQALAWPVGSSLGASRQIGGSGLGFSCDVNTQKCECQGVETGADCVAMKKNCTGNLTCLDPITYPGQAYRCFCSMSQAARPQGIRPRIKETMKLAPQ